VGGSHSVIDEIASSDISPTTNKLRLMLEAALHEIETDIVTCFLHRDLVPFAGKLSELSRTRGRGDSEAAFEYWPFYAAGIYDPAPLFAMVSPSRAQRFEELRDGDVHMAGLYPGSLRQAMFSFLYRERIESAYRISVHTPGLDPEADPGAAPRAPLALLFFSLRDSGPAGDATTSYWRRSLRARRRALRGGSDRRSFAEAQRNQIHQFAQAFGKVTEALRSDVDGHLRDRRRVYDTRTEEFAAGVDRLRDSIKSRRQKGTLSLSDVIRYFRWPLDVAIRIARDPTAFASYHCVARCDDKDPRYAHITRRRPTGRRKEDDERLVLIGIANAGIHEPARRFSLTRPYLYADMWDAFRDAVRSQRPCRDGARSASWRARDVSPMHHIADEYPQPKRRARRPGLITVATQLKAPLYLMDARRRFCKAAPLYGLSYAEPYSGCKSAFCIPLLQRQPEDAEQYALGAVSLECDRRIAIRPGEASYLAALFQIAADEFPAEALDLKFEVPRP
jgi:hypothetical protein